MKKILVILIVICSHVGIAQTNYYIYDNSTGVSYKVGYSEPAYTAPVYTAPDNSALIDAINNSALQQQRAQEAYQEGREYMSNQLQPGIQPIPIGGTPVISPDEWRQVEEAGRRREEFDRLQEEIREKENTSQKNNIDLAPTLEEVKRAISSTQNTTAPLFSTQSASNSSDQLKNSTDSNRDLNIIFCIFIFTAILTLTLRYIWKDEGGKNT